MFATTSVKHLITGLNEITDLNRRIELKKHMLEGLCIKWKIQMAWLSDNDSNHICKTPDNWAERDHWHSENW